MQHRPDLPLRRAQRLRGGWFRSTGDNNPSDPHHNTFFTVLPTPRVYAQLSFYNQMNNTDEFVQVIDAPTKKLRVRSDLHFLQLTSSKDLWYQGGGAFDNKVFGFVGRPANGHGSFATMRVAVQEYGASNPEFLSELTERCAEVAKVPVYQWGLLEDVRPLRVRSIPAKYLSRRRAAVRMKPLRQHRQPRRLSPRSRGHLPPCAASLHPRQPWQASGMG